MIIFFCRTVKSDTNIVRAAQRLDEEKEIVSKFGVEDYVKGMLSDLLFGGKATL